ncbi:hypothetical protein ABZP36_029639 [Zizania latifolia]
MPHDFFRCPTCQYASRLQLPLYATVGYEGYGLDVFAAPPAGYLSAYGAPPMAYGDATAAPRLYGAGGPVMVEETKKKNKIGMGTGLAVGAVAGVLGGLAPAGGASYLEDKFEEGMAEKVEDDLARDEYVGGYDDDY